MHHVKMAVTNMLFHHVIIEFLVKEGNSAGIIYKRLCGVYGDAYMGASIVRRWVKQFKDGNTDITNQSLCVQLSATSRKSTDSSYKTKG
jgi:hypothetical protein